MNPKTTIKESNYKGQSLVVNHMKDREFHSEILDRNMQLLNHMLSKHSQILLLRFDVRFPYGMTAPIDNDIFQKFIENYARYLRRKHYDPHYLWAREQKLKRNQHYHVYFLLDANEIRYIQNLIKAEEQWGSALQIPLHMAKGLIHICQIDYRYNSMIIRRYDAEAYDKAFRIVSYLAKTEHKGATPYNTRAFGSSLLR